MNWEPPEKINLKRLKCIKDELEEFINMLEHQYDNTPYNDKKYINTELYSDTNYKHKTRTTKQLNVNMSNLEQNESKT